MENLNAPKLKHLKYQFVLNFVLIYIMICEFQTDPSIFLRISESDSGYKNLWPQPYLTQFNSVKRHFSGVLGGFPALALAPAFSLEEYDASND